MDSAFKYLQEAFQIIQVRLCYLRLILNANKSRTTLFINSLISILKEKELRTTQGTIIGLTSYFKYLGITTDEELSFRQHVQQLQS